MMMVIPSSGSGRPFHPTGLDCVLLSDRYGVSRDRCTMARLDVEAERTLLISPLRQMPQRFANVRLIDPIDLFCDSWLCKPFDDNRVHFSDRDWGPGVGQPWPCPDRPERGRDRRLQRRWNERYPLAGHQRRYCDLVHEQIAGVQLRLSR